MRWRRFGVAAVLAVVAAAISVAAIPTGREPTIRAVRAEADAYVSAANRTANFGKARGLRVARQPRAHTYLRFKLEDSEGEVRRVSLLLFSRTTSRRGYKVHRASGRWRERRLSYNNAPRIFSRAIRSGALRARAWQAVDVTSIVAWDGSDEKTVSLALTANGTAAIELASRESGLTGPRLVIELEDENGSTKSGTQPPPPASS